jgi:7-cyano-7-deazaguanine tRNA-ribosyltransferase
MSPFELLERDGLARLGRLDTPHGAIETPALLPVVHPDPGRQPVAPSEMRRRFGVRAVITSAYITWRTPPLRSGAEEHGIHGLLDFDGPVMTDSGAFQQHAYGSVEIGPEESLEFQERIRSDIATVLDVFTEPEATHEEAASALRTTRERADTARARRRGLLAVPVQGGAYPDLRAESAAAASEQGDVLAVGGVVPLLEQYRFPELAEVLAATRPHLTPGAPVHLFGTGHPMMFALAALWGVDLFDSSAYHKFARRGSLLLPEGTLAVEEVREEICRCALCAEHPLPEVARLPPLEREHALALHNLRVSVEEVARVRQAIREGTLWELAERRMTAHPALRAGVETSMDHSAAFLPTEPDARRAFRETGPASLRRPAVILFHQGLDRYRQGRPLPEPIPRVALRPEYLARVPTEDRSGRAIAWEAETPLGPVPLELTELYPVGPYLGVDEFVDRRRHRPASAVTEELRGRRDLDVDLDRVWADAWTRRQVAGLLEWEYGPEVSAAIAGTLSVERSRRSGRLRALVGTDGILFHVGTDGLPRPTYRGALELRPLLTERRHRVVVANDAREFVAHGRSLFARFVVDADPGLRPGSNALLVDASDELLAVGRLLLAPQEMSRMARGVAVRVTAHPHAPDDGLEEEPAEEARDR